MPELLKTTIIELQKIILEEYKVSLSFSEVSEIAHGLVSYFDILGRIKNKIEKNYEQ